MSRVQILNELMEQLRSIFLRPSGGLNIIGMVVAAIVLLIIAHLVVTWTSKLVGKYIQKREATNKGNQRRVKTLSKLLGNLAKYAVYIVALMIFLDLSHINTSTILATAGLGSIAIAMGAQAVIKDLINGFFIIFDDQYSVGDYVECAGKSGYVQNLGIRTTIIRDFDGSIHTVPNSQIDIVTNRGRGRQRAKVVIPVDREESPERVLLIFKEALKKLSAEYDHVSVDIWGITSTIENGYEITVVGWEEASLQFDLEYDMRQCLIEAMQANDIHMPKFRIKSKDQHQEVPIE